MVDAHQFDGHEFVTQEIMKARGWHAAPLDHNLANEQLLITISWLRESNKQYQFPIHYLRKQKSSYMFLALSAPPNLHKLAHVRMQRKPQKNVYFTNSRLGNLKQTSSWTQIRKLSEVFFKVKKSLKSINKLNKIVRNYETKPQARGSEQGEPGVQALPFPKGCQLPGKRRLRVLSSDFQDAWMVLEACNILGTQGGRNPRGLGVNRKEWNRNQFLQGLLHSAESRAWNRKWV